MIAARPSSLVLSEEGQGRRRDRRRGRKIDVKGGERKGILKHCRKRKRKWDKVRIRRKERCKKNERK